MRRITGFTLIELLIVVTVIAVLIVFATGGMRASRKSTNEASTIAFFKSSVVSNEQYRTRYGSFAPTFDDLVASGFFADGQNPSGYALTYAPALNSWAFRGQPKELGETGDRYFYVDQSGIIRASQSGPANSTSTPID